MNLQKLKKDLMSKGIFVVASTNEITAGLAWSVEGIEKVPRLGELLFYKVNGVEYGVKPKKGNKHDIQWYYDQLKTGMKGARGYSAGLTQFLNVWIKKGELVIVFKGNKATASVTSAKRLSSKEKCDAIINGLKNGSINEDELFKTITKEYNLTPDCVAATRWLIKEWGQEDIKNNNEWPIRFKKLYNLHGVKFLNKYLNDLLFDSRSELSGGSSESILDGLYKKFKGDKIVASPQLISEKAIDNILLTEMNLNVSKKQNADEDVEWTISKGRKSEFVVKYQDGVASIYTVYGSVLYKDIKTAIEFRKKMGEAFQARLGKQATAASPRKYRPSIRERMDRDSYLDPLSRRIDSEYPGERDYKRKFNKFKKEIQDIKVLGFKPFYVWSNFSEEDEKYHTIIELRNAEIKLEPISSEKERLLDALNTLNEKYKFKILDIDGLSISFNAFIGNNCSGNSNCFELRSIKGSDGFDWFLKNIKTECKLLEQVVEPFSDIKVTASKAESDNEDFYQSVKKVANKYQWTLKLTGRSDEYHLLKGDDQINVSYGYNSKFNKHTYHIDVIHDTAGHNYWLKSQKEFNKTLDDICSKLKKGEYNETRYEVTADLEEGEDPETEISAFIDDVNGLTIGGKRVFNAEKKEDSIVINLLIKKFETDDMDRLNEIVEDKLEILFPITQKWMDADKGQTWGDRKKAGDITMYVEEFSPAEFSDQLVIEDCSKIDWKNLPTELHAIYTTLKNDCETLSGSNNFKVTADVCEVKETLGELNEENFEGINKEHDRLMYIKVTPEQFLQLWKTSPNFNGQQIQKIVYGFKLALRTLNSKFENKGILIECFYKKKDGKGYIRVEYDKDLYIIYVSRSEDNGEVKVITRKMRKVIPTKNFNLLSTSVSSLAFERSNLPSGFKPIWEDVSK